MLRGVIQSWRDNPIKWLAGFFACIVSGALAWPYLREAEPIVRVRMEQYFDGQMKPFVDLTNKLYLGGLYQRCDKILAEAKSPADKTKVDRQLRHLDSEIKLAESKANVSDYGGCQQ